MNNSLRADAAGNGFHYKPSSPGKAPKCSPGISHLFFFKVKNIKAILFDFGQTLVDSAQGFRAAEDVAKNKIFSLLLSESVFTSSNMDHWPIFVSRYRSIRKKYHALSTFSRISIWKTVWKEFAPSPDMKILAQMETDYWNTVKSMTTPFPETISVLDGLKPRFQLGLITNTQGQNSSERHRLALFPELEKYFEAIIVAGEQGLPTKPDSKPFQVCLDRMKVHPSHAVYVGDDYEKDVLGAWAAGLFPVWLKHRNVKRSWPAPKKNRAVNVITSLDQLDTTIKKAALSP